jgi:hypothetical protein
VFRFIAKPDKIDRFVETFTIEFADIRTNGVDLALNWENTRVAFPIEFDVDGNVDRQIAELLKDPSDAAHFNYFLAAEYYFHNDRDLTKAVGWITTALEKSPKNPRYGLLAAKILYKQGKKAAALSTIAEANAWAKESSNANYVEQTQLFWDSIK